MLATIEKHLGDKAKYLLNFKSPKIPQERLHLPEPEFIDRIFSASDRNNRVLGSLQRLFGHGRLGGTGYLSILPVDQGIEHSAGASFAKKTLITSIRRTLCALHSRETAMPSRLHSESSVSSHESTRIRFLLS